MKRRLFFQMCGYSIAGAGLLHVQSCNRKSADLYLRPLTGKVLDAHMHVDSQSIPRCLRVMDDNHIRYGINMGLIGNEFYEFMDAVLPYKHRLGAMYAFDWNLIQEDELFFEKAPDMLEQAINAGALGVKCFKDLGLTVKGPEGAQLRVDDPRLFPIWERAEKLNVIVSFHTSDPKAFFEPLNPQNERWAELGEHPDWSFGDRSKYPPREKLLEQRNNVIRQFPNVKFQGCHVANNPEDLDVIDKWLDDMPNFYIDVAARLGELGRHPSSKGHALFTKHKNRMMFGTDHQFYQDGEVQGTGPLKIFTKEENDRFYQSHWRYFQTDARQFDHPTPIQGNWKIDGIALGTETLKKLYWDNAVSLYRLERLNVG